MEWQIVIAIIAGLGLLGSIIWRFAALEIKTKNLPTILEAIRNRLTTVEIRVNDIFDIFLEDGRSRRRDMREHHSKPRLTKEGKALIPDDVKECITKKRIMSNNQMPGREMIFQLKQELTIERLSQDAVEHGLGLIEYLALLADYCEEEK
jgi:hypothetical protein